jgi:hypothetical protein
MRRCAQTFDWYCMFRLNMVSLEIVQPLTSNVTQADILVYSHFCVFILGWLNWFLVAAIPSSMYVEHPSHRLFSAAGFTVRHIIPDRHGRNPKWHPIPYILHFLKPEIYRPWLKVVYYL